MIKYAIYGAIGAAVYFYFYPEKAPDFLKKYLPAKAPTAESGNYVQPSLDSINTLSKR